MADRTTYDVPGEPGLITATTRATAAATAGTTAVFLLPIPMPGQHLVSLVCKSTASGTKQANALAAVSWVRPAAGEKYQASATMLHTGLTTNITAITVGTPTATGMLPVSVTYGAGETNGSVDGRWRATLGAFDFTVQAAAGALNDVPTLTGVPAVGTVTDSFSRADSASTLGTTEVGALAWSALQGTWGVTGGLAYNVTAASNDVAVVNLGKTDFSVEVTLAVMGGGSGLAFGVVDINNFYLLQPFGGGWRFMKRVAGSFTAITITNSAPVTGSRIGVSRSLANKFTFSLDGSVKATVTDTSLTAGQKVGLYSDGTATARWDDFIAT